MTLAVALLVQTTERDSLAAQVPRSARTRPDPVSAVCAHLHQTVPDSVPLVLVDAGSPDAVVSRLANFAATSHARLVALPRTEYRADIVCDTVRRITGCRHVLLLRAHNRLVAGQLARLADWLARHDPDLAVLSGGWWLSEPPRDVEDRAGAMLGFPDALRQSPLPDTPLPEALLALTPDPRRLLSAQRSAPEHDPFADPAAAWAAWETALCAGTEVMLFPDPVLLQPWPRVHAERAVAVLADRLQATPRGAQADLLARLAPWVGDMLCLSAARDAVPLAKAIQALWAQMPWRLRGRAVSLPDPAGAVFWACGKGQLLGSLALLAGARNEMLTDSLIEDQRRLRDELDLALPGPEYLADLYARVRDL